MLCKFYGVEVYYKGVKAEHEAGVTAKEVRTELFKKRCGNLNEDEPAEQSRHKTKQTNIVSCT